MIPTPDDLRTMADVLAAQSAAAKQTMNRCLEAGIHDGASKAESIYRICRKASQDAQAFAESLEETLRLSDECKAGRAA